jgi:hypothetical protein
MALTKHIVLCVHYTDVDIVLLAFTSRVAHPHKSSKYYDSSYASHYDTAFRHTIRIRHLSIDNSDFRFYERLTANQLDLLSGAEAASVTQVEFARQHITDAGGPLKHTPSTD